MMYVIVLSAILGALGIYYYLFKDLNRFKKYNIPHVKPVPIMGNMAPTIFRTMSLFDLMKKIYDVHPEAKYVGMYDFTAPAIVLRDIELIKSIALKNFDVFPNRRTIITEEQDPLFGKNLVFLHDERWRELRALLSPSFTSSKMKGMFKLMSDYAVEFAQFVANMPLEQRTVMNIKDIFTRYTSDVIATCAFGISVNSMRDPKNSFYLHGKEATNFRSSTSLKIFIFRMLPTLARIINLKFIPQKVADFFKDVIATTVKTRDEKGIVRSDMLQLMMESRGKNDGRRELTIEDMVSQAFVFFIAGFDNTATLMYFAAYEIAVNENVRKRLQNEIDQVLEDTKGQAPYEAINNMTYLEAVLNETLRIYSNPFVDRLCSEDFELPPTLPDTKPYTVKKGQVVYIPVYALHHDPKYFKQPEKFDPDRFLGDQKKHILSTGAYMPFGLGPRICIANRFALMEMKVLIFHLLARCDLLPCEKTPIPMKLAKEAFILKPEGGFWLKVMPRKEPHHTTAVTE